MEIVLSRRDISKALDLGCGGGHVSYRAALYAAHVTACDVTPSMLDAVARTAREKGLNNIETCLAPAEKLPFGDASFDAVLCRFSAHHWVDFSGGLREARRVADMGAVGVFIDTVAPPGSVSDTHLQAMELLRDPSHVRNYAVAQWCGALAEAGFAVQSCTTRRVRMEFESWVKRTHTPVHMVEAILGLQRGAPDIVGRYFAIAPDGSFDLDVATMIVRAI
ncbi:class I SAM-dependent methyltransferase [Acidocella sp.]|uniref:class I SAM-dependent methyltransferase n=1 Tax=Acidocella sp. TaxID=50710 RepID=UPI003D01557C